MEFEFEPLNPKVSLSPGPKDSFLLPLPLVWLSNGNKVEGRREKRASGMWNSNLMTFGECLLIGPSWYILLRKEKAYE